MKVRITVAAPAKVNLRLRVGPREPSGFHAIDTLFCSLHLADSVVVRPGDAPAPTLTLGHAPPLTALPDMGPLEDNLAYRAARAFMDRAGLATGPEIRVVKRIPTGGGLGGGSSDAAAVLRGLARLNPGAVPAGDLLELGTALGSDVPFFVRGAPLARGTGRGERLAPLPALPARAVVVAIPDFPVSTADAFAWLDEDRPDTTAVPDRPGHDATELDWETVAAEAANDFEGPVFRRHPRLAELKDGLRDHGARPALLAGSGSTVFGVFEDRKAAHAAVQALRQWDPTLRVIETRTRER